MFTARYGLIPYIQQITFRLLKVKVACKLTGVGVPVVRRVLQFVKPWSRDKQKVLFSNIIFLCLSVLTVDNVHKSLGLVHCNFFLERSCAMIGIMMAHFFFLSALAITFDGT